MYIYTYIYIYITPFFFAFTAHRSQRSFYAGAARLCGGMPHPQYVAYCSVYYIHIYIYTYTYIYIYITPFFFAFTAHRSQRAFYAGAARPRGGMPHPIAAGSRMGYFSPSFAGDYYYYILNCTYLLIASIVKYESD